MNDGLTAARLTARREEAWKRVEELRKRLLDLSNRNRLLELQVLRPLAYPRAHYR